MDRALKKTFVLLGVLAAFGSAAARSHRSTLAAGYSYLNSLAESSRWKIVRCCCS
jgi:hypothetical protein